MLFNSMEFIIFFPAVCLVYYVIPHKIRYLFLLGCSYFFYICWNPEYALLMLTSTAITYASGLLIDSDHRGEEAFQSWDQDYQRYEAAVKRSRK